LFGSSIRAASTSSPLSTVQHDRDGAVVDELERHPGAEDSGRDLDAEQTESGAETVVERLRVLGAGGIVEAPPVALPRVRDQREVRDDEYSAARVEERAVEPAVVSLEDPETRDLAGDAVRNLRVVGGGDPEEDDEAGPDLAAWTGAGAQNPLDDGAHAGVSRARGS